MKYDFLIVGCGLFGVTFSQLARENGLSCLIIEKRDHIGGNVYTHKNGDIHIHQYGPHIFHTNNKKIWDYVNRFTTFNSYINRPKVSYNGKIYSFPINLFTLYQLWGVTNPTEAKSKLDSVKIHNDNPKNLEEWILSQVGEEIYYTFIHGYTKKQWGTEPKNLPSSIIKRLPIRLNFDDNYFFDYYQGIPTNGYTEMISNMLGDTPVLLNVDYFSNRSYYDSLANKVLYTGPIDKFYEYEHGSLSYRGLRFETKNLDVEDFQGNAIINYTSFDVTYTRIIEHKHFLNTKCTNTIVTKEFPDEWDSSKEPFYPMNDYNNQTIYDKYKKLSLSNNKYIFGGRLAEYMYYDMHQVIGSATSIFNKILL